MMNKEKLNDIKLYGLYKDLYNSVYRNLSEILSDLNDNVYFSDIDKFDSFQKIIENIKNIIAKSEIMWYNIIWKIL